MQQKMDIWIVCVMHTPKDVPDLRSGKIQLKMLLNMDTLNVLNMHIQMVALWIGGHKDMHLKCDICSLTTNKILNVWRILIGYVLCHHFLNICALIRRLRQF